MVVMFPPSSDGLAAATGWRRELVADFDLMGGGTEHSES